MTGADTGPKVATSAILRAVAVSSLCGIISTVQASAQASLAAHRPVTVADVIGLTTFGSQPHGSVPRDIDVSSPDGRFHAVIVKRGDVAQNTNVFSLLLFKTEGLFNRPTPDTLLTLPSSSNRPAISNVEWLADNRTLALLCERPGELPQVYTLDVLTRQFRQLTRHTTEITSYDIEPLGDVIVYTAKAQPDTSGYAAMREHGFVLRPTQFVGDVLQGAWYATIPSWSVPNQLLVWNIRAGAPLVARLPGPSYRSCDPTSVSIAPGGRVALIKCQRARAPALWTGYKDATLAKLLQAGEVPPEFALLNLDRGTIEPLVDAPVRGATFRWSPTGDAVILANAFLPLDIADLVERAARQAGRGIAEVDLRTRRVATVAHQDGLDVVAWNASTNTVDLVPGRYGLGSLDAPRVRYRKTAHGWRQVRGGFAEESLLTVEQGLNLPPRLVAVDRNAKRHVVVFDPNLDFAQLRMARVEVLRWRTRSGGALSGGLYYPPDFDRGRRYPLVIQTHGFDSTAFAPDGIFPTANAAQAMATHDILVLQMDDIGWFYNMLTPREAEAAMEEIEGAIDHLDSLGVIDRSRVGLIGFSRTCFHVLYMLTHSRHPIAASAVTDGKDFGYLQYLLFETAQLGAGNTLHEYTEINGPSPFGEGLATWRARAPGFNLDRVRAPLRLEAIGLSSVLEEWEPYAGLLLQHKPVELFVIPQGTHLLVKPWERLASSQSNVDWFRFWLKGEEDPDTAKAEQYARWRELRKLQEQQGAADTSATRH